MKPNHQILALGFTFLTGAVLGSYYPDLMLYVVSLAVGGLTAAAVMMEKGKLPVKGRKGDKQPKPEPNVPKPKDDNPP